MAALPDKSYTHDHDVRSDGSVAFTCSQDRALWPWLALSAEHPVLIQSINFWASVESGIARGTFDPTKWSALTQTEWNAHAAGPITHGLAWPMQEGSPDYGLTFFNAKGAEVCKMSGTGVVFRTRDFEAWRSKAKTRPDIKDEPWACDYAAANLVGVGSARESFLTELQCDDRSTARGLITAENGLIPNHPFLDGSGDHVNSTHIAEVARQFACLSLEREQVSVTGGEMHFMRYVELGRPFEVVKADTANGYDLSLLVRQTGRDCSTVSLKLSD